MKIASLTLEDLRDRLARGQLRLDIHPFSARLQSDVPEAASALRLLYGEFACLPDDGFSDFHVQVSREPGLRRWYRPQARFSVDGRAAFVPLPAHHAPVMFEWGLNWCVASHGHQFLILHAAVVEKNGMAALLPAPPGSGKSTLCAGLVNRGWRLLSDELALYDMDSGLVHGMARPVNLKNRSIEVIQRFAPEAVFTAPVADTSKGTVALMRPPDESVRRRTEPARLRWLVLPRYVPDAAATLELHSKAQTFLLVAEQSYNYDIHGQRAFRAVESIIDSCDCYQFSYSALEDAVRTFDALAAA
ncbi:HprK-related kinase A [Paucibacter sp. M5-1]|uniref:HprK-related kinase A n=1 Tax=Paucibacter sp. M5-1 TaxID=3015998 RepID=UPI003F811A92